ncbi:hypothetical protein BC628DRAFT_243219 [Trametes gibbosa]|nr:hypothetical protein BC628DRAFT_243219 [Trametes gibbosa]
MFTSTVPVRVQPALVLVPSSRALQGDRETPDRDQEPPWSLSSAGCVDTVRRADPGPLAGTGLRLAGVESPTPKDLRKIRVASTGRSRVNESASSVLSDMPSSCVAWRACSSDRCDRSSTPPFPFPPPQAARTQARVYRTDVKFLGASSFRGRPAKKKRRAELGAA